MKAHAVSPFVAGHVIPPLLRPLPTIFSYAQHASENPSFFDRFPDLQKDFDTHITCFIALLEKACSSAKLPADDCRTVMNKAKALKSATPIKLVNIVDQLDLELAHFSEVHKSALREIYNMQPELFKTEYRIHIKPSKLALAYHSSAYEGVPKLLETLTERCYYEAKPIDETYLTASLRSLDLIVFAPSQEPISSNIIDRMREQEVPFLVLVNLGKDIQRADMVQTRLAALYQKNSIQILHRPFPAIRMFHKIDNMLVERKLATAKAETVEKQKVTVKA